VKITPDRLLPEKSNLKKLKSKSFKFAKNKDLNWDENEDKYSQLSIKQPLMKPQKSGT